VRIPVWLAAWQVECCGEPFVVHDRVSWPLLFQEAGDELPPRSPLEVLLHGEVRDAERRREVPAAAGVPTSPGRTLAADAALMHWATDDVPLGPARVRGVASVERHGAVPEDLPPTIGVVHRIRVARLPSGRPWTFADVDERGLRHEHACPSRFVVSRDGLAEVGVLVELDVVDWHGVPGGHSLA
jgi:hypothetical protein